MFITRMSLDRRFVKKFLVYTLSHTLKFIFIVKRETSHECNLNIVHIDDKKNGQLLPLFY